MSVSSRGEWEKLEKSENLMLGGAVGAPEVGNMLGMPTVMSLQRIIASGVIWRPHFGLFFSNIFLTFF
jgi:hypothetical protein